MGAFPTPVHGMAVVNEAVRDRFVEAGVEPVVIDVSATSLDRSLAVRLGRLPKVVRGLGRMLFSRCSRDGSLYMSVSGGAGQVYEVFFLLLARLRRMRVYLHHHSFAYLDRPSWITRVLTAVAGPASVHITQSPGMAARLLILYPSVRRVIPISNAVFLIGGRAQTVSARSALKTLGFISNISAEKGVFEFLDLVAASEAEGVMLQAKLAGPFQDTETERRVRQRLGELRTVEYVGPQYGEAKEAFFATIDALIFPTHNETEGIVNHEAMCHGLPVIVYGRGCIPEIVQPDCGLVIDPMEPFVPAAAAQIKAWIDSPEVFQAASRVARERFVNTYEDNARRWEDLVREILGPDANDDSEPVSTVEDPPSQT